MDESARGRHHTSRPGLKVVVHTHGYRKSASITVVTTVWKDGGRIPVSQIHLNDMMPVPEHASVNELLNAMVDYLDQHQSLF